MRKIVLGISYIVYRISTATPVYAQGPKAAGPTQLVQMFTRIINLAAEAAFTVLLIMLVYGGIKFLTSGGDPKAISSAQSTITWAFLGILFLAIGWLVLVLIHNFTGVDVTKFCIGFGDCK